MHGRKISKSNSQRRTIHFPTLLRSLSLLCFLWRVPSEALPTLTTPLRTIGYGGIGEMTVSPDGSRLLITAQDGRVRLHDASDGAVLKTYPDKPSAISDAVFSPDGHRLALGIKLSYGTDRNGHKLGGLSAILVCDAHTGDSLALFTDVTSMYTTFAFSPDGKALLVGMEDLRCLLLDSAMATRLSAKTTAPLQFIRFSADASRILTVSRDTTATTWDGTSLTPIHSIRNLFQWTSTPFAFSPSGSQIAVWGFGGLNLIQAATGDTIKNGTGQNSPPLTEVYRIAFSHRGDLVVAAGRNGFNDSAFVQVWNTKTGDYLGSFPGAPYTDFDPYVGFSPDDSELIANDASNGNAYVWILGSKQLLQKVPGWIRGEPGLDGLGHLTFTTWVSGDYDTVIHMDMASGTRRSLRLTDYYWAEQGGAFSPDGSKVLVESSSGVRVFDAATGRIASDIPRAHLLPQQGLYVVSNPDGSVSVFDLDQVQVGKSNTHSTISPSFVKTPQGKILVTYDAPNFLTNMMWDTLQVRDLSTNAVIFQRVSTRRTDDVQFSPSGKYIYVRTSNSAAFSFRDSFNIYDLDQGKALWDTSGVDWGFGSTEVAFSPDESCFLLKGEIFGTRSNKFVASLGREDAVLSAFSPDGKYMVAQNILYDASTWKPLWNFIPGGRADTGGSFGPLRPAFSSDGKTLLSYDHGAPTLWDMNPVLGILPPPHPLQAATLVLVRATCDFLRFRISPQAADAPTKVDLFSASGQRIAGLTIGPNVQSSSILTLNFPSKQRQGMAFVRIQTSGQRPIQEPIFLVP